MTKPQTTYLPFPALVGLELAQQALVLLAIEPRLRGVVIASSAGTGKTSLARGLRDLIQSDDDAIPFVEIPASIDGESLLGGLDLEATLKQRKMVLQRGVLARADGGLAYVDGVNLLTDEAANLLLTVLDEGQVRVERESMSYSFPSRFSLIGSYDPAEGQPRQHLVDRIGLIVTLPHVSNSNQREDVLHRNLFAMGASWGDDVDFLRGLILTAREQLPNVKITDDQIQQLTATSLAYGVEGHRADHFAVLAACAAAAYDFRDVVEDDDLRLAAQLVILPRATQIPAPPEESSAQPPEQQEEAPTDELPPQSDKVDDEDESSSALPEQLAPQPEQILEALKSVLPEVLDELPFKVMRRGRTGSRGATEGKRGRHVRSIAGDPRRNRIDVVATLRSATPWQPLRRSSQSGQQTVHLEMRDIRVKQYRSKAGALFCFAVDASGSMALHRMQQAKGAVHKLLEQAYVNRDRVALIGFRGERAELLLPLSQSVELASRALDQLPTGGGTPLASALLLSADVAAQARQKGIFQTILVLLTDGRGNVPLETGANAAEELRNLAPYIHESGMKIVVVDTKRDYLSKGEARQLADLLQAEYAYLPSATSDDIATIADSHAVR